MNTWVWTAAGVLYLSVSKVYHIRIYYRIYSNVMRTFFGQIALWKLGCALDSIANLRNTADHAVVRPR
jgi:hypothetical protein